MGEAVILCTQTLSKVTGTYLLTNKQRHSSWRAHTNHIHLCSSLLPSRFPLPNMIFADKFKNKSWFDKRNTTISLYNCLICWLIVISFSLSRPTLPLSEMFQSCSGPDNRWVVRQVDDGQGLYNSEPYSHGWAQLRLPRPGGTVHHFCSDYACGSALNGAHPPVRWQSQNMWTVGNHHATT